MNLFLQLKNHNMNKRSVENGEIGSGMKEENMLTETFTYSPEVSTSNVMIDAEATQSLFDVIETVETTNESTSTYNLDDFNFISNMSAFFFFLIIFLFICFCITLIEKIFIYFKANFKKMKLFNKLLHYVKLIWLKSKK